MKFVMMFAVVVALMACETNPPQNLAGRTGRDVSAAMYAIAVGTYYDSLEYIDGGAEVEEDAE